MKKVFIAALLLVGLNIMGTAQTTTKKETPKTEVSSTVKQKKAKKHHKKAKKHHKKAAHKQEATKK